MNIKLLKKIKQINREVNANVKIVSHANLIVSEDTISLETDGMLSTMLIQYTGAVFFTKQFSFLSKLIITKNTILITNLFKQNIKNTILSYSGDLKITHCKIFNFNQTYIIPKIENKEQEKLVSASKTNLEDNDEILYDFHKRSKRQKLSRGHTPHYLNSVGAKKIASKRFTKGEVIKIAHIVAKTLQKASAISKSTVTTVKPSVSAPAPQVTAPSAFTSAPTITKIIKEERKKY